MKAMYILLALTAFFSGVSAIALVMIRNGVAENNLNVRANTAAVYSLTKLIEADDGRIVPVRIVGMPEDVLASALEAAPAPVVPQSKQKKAGKK